jgi:group I intron endonuclease
MQFLGVIYKISNCKNNLQYIGLTRSSQSETTRKKVNTHEKILSKRWREHSNCKNIDDFLHNAIKKYGIASFDVQIIEKYEANTYEEITITVNTAEVNAIKKFNTMAPNGYNLQTGGNSSVIHDETRKKISEAQKKRMTSEMREHLSKINTGKKQSPETLKKKSESRTGVKWSDKKRESMTGRKNTEETRQKMSKAQKGRIISEEAKQKMSKAKKKFSEAQVFEIRQNVDNLNQKEIALKYGVSKQLINNIVNCKKAYAISPISI